MKTTYTHKTRHQAQATKNAKHWKKVREKEWLDSFEEEKEPKPTSYRELAKEMYQKWEELVSSRTERRAKLRYSREVSIPIPEWEDYLASSGLSRRTRYYIKKCVSQYYSDPHVGWNFDEDPLIQEAAYWFPLEEKARAVLKTVQESGVEPIFRAKSLADLMAKDKLEEKELIEFVALATKVANKKRGLDSPYQPNFRLLWGLHVRAPKAEPWMKETLLKVLSSKDLYLTKDQGRQVVSPVRLGNPADLFDACKAWEISVLFPKKIAVRVGRLPLWKRMAAGQVIKQLLEERCGLTWHSSFRVTYSLSNDDWTTAEFHQEFWLRFSEATRKGKMKSLESLIGEKINNKRILSCVIEDSCLVKALKEYVGANLSLAETIEMRNFLGIKSSALKEILEIKGMLEFSLRDFHLLPTYIGLVAIFGKNWKSYVDKVATIEKLYRPGEVKKDTEKLKKVLEGMHDYLYWVQPLGTPVELKGLDGFLLKWLKEHTGELGIIVNTWHRLPGKAKESNSFKEVLSAARALSYEGLKNEPFGQEAGKWGMDTKEYPKAEDIYLQSLKVKVPFSTEVQFELDDYVARFLPRADVRVGFFGHYTNCCQHWTGIGKKCAISSVRDPFAQLFVVEKKGEIIAGSWVWETHNQVKEYSDFRYSGVCFDNVEAKGLSSNQHHVVLELYKKAAAHLIQTGSYCKVTVGTNLGDLDISSLDYDDSPLQLPARYSGYTDSSKGQKVLESCWEPARMYKIFSSNNSQVWVRGAIEEDLENINQVAAACYEATWAQTMSLAEDPNNAHVLLLEHIDQGIVGYASLDIHEKYVCDLAVLPEYRNFSNLLLKETLEFMKSEGGAWEADAKEDTSYRLLKLYEKRGKLQLEVLYPSHSVDGIPTYRVRITFD